MPSNYKITQDKYGNMYSERKTDTEIILECMKEIKDGNYYGGMRRLEKLQKGNI